MYNRYIPQPDGSYQRRQVPQNQRKPIPPPSPEPSPPPKSKPNRCRSCQDKRQSESPLSGISAFLSQWLPKDFDTADLMVILLLLLMSGDCKEDQNTALLTLALYLFL